MYRKILVTGVTAAAIVGAGTAALATTGSDPTPGSPSTTSAAHAKGDHQGKAGKGKGKKGHAARGKLLRRLEHAQIVTKGKDGPVTHDLIRGTVTAVSSTSITVQAADKKSETFAVTKDTKVVARASSKGSKPAKTTISKVAKGDTVLVAGTGTSSYTAKHVLDRGQK